MTPTTATPATTSKEFFEQKYLLADDPWNFATDGYEQRRYQAILNALGERRFERAFEPGCSVGVLTQHLALQCGHLTAMDISPTATERARDRCMHLANTEILCGALPEQIPDGKFDLIVFSEIGYYFQLAELRSLVNQLTHHLHESGVFLACHWLGTSADHLLGGDNVHRVLGLAANLRHNHGERCQEFRLDRWTKK